MSARILHVDLDAFFVEVCRQRNPELRHIELLVVGGRREQRGVVQSASYGARRYGIHAGMPIAQAVRLCPEATFFQGSFPHYREASQAVRAVLERFSPVVVMASLDEAYLDFGGTDRLHPVSLLPAAETIRDAVREATGLDCSIGIGPNRMIAKLASDQAKPRGLMEVRAGWETGFLAGLPLSAMPGVGPKTAARWAELGLTDVWQIQQMEEAALARLIGPDARALKRRALGHGGTTLRAEQLPKSVSRETTLSRDLRDPEELEAILFLLTTRVAGQLRDEGRDGGPRGLEVHPVGGQRNRRRDQRPGDSGERILARGVDLHHHHHVGAGERLGELRREVLGAAVKVRLEDRDHPAVSRRAAPPHWGQVACRQVGWRSSGLPGTSKVTSWGSRTGRFCFASGTVPQVSQCRTGIGQPQ